MSDLTKQSVGRLSASLDFTADLTARENDGLFEALLGRSRNQLFGMPVIETRIGTTKERPPTPGEEARRIVRHGYADVLEWLGEEVGPEPDEPVTVQYAYLLPRTTLSSGGIVMSPEGVAVLRMEAC